MKKKDLESLLEGTGVIPAPRHYFEVENELKAGFMAITIAFLPPFLLFILGITLTLFL